MTFVIPEHRVPSARGLVLGRTRRGRPISAVDRQRWLRHLITAHGVLKVDLLVDGTDGGADFVVWAYGEGIAPSLRSACDDLPPPLSKLRDAGLHDVFLTPPRTDSVYLEHWLAAARDAEIPVRLQVTGAPGAAEDVEELATHWTASGVRSVRFRLADPFVDGVPCRSAEQSTACIARMSTLAEALTANEIECVIEDVPFCLVDERLRGVVQQGPQGAVDHQGYVEESETLAAKLYGRSAWTVSRVIKAKLARDMLHQHPADNLLLPWMLDRQAAHLAAGVWMRLTRGRRFGGKPLPISRQRYEHELDAARKRGVVNPVCGACSHRRICDGATESFRAHLPGLSARTLGGDELVDVLHYARGCARYLDAIDRARTSRPDREAELAREANRLMADAVPDVRVHPKDYGIENAFFERYEGGLKWFVVEAGERVSTLIARLEPPFLVSVDVGGGLAERFGFRIGRGFRAVAPMIGFRHSFALYANEAGDYVLLRDGEAVATPEPDGLRAQALRVPDAADVRLCAIDIEEVVTTYNLRVWSDGSRRMVKTKPVYSVIVVSTRFSRRLQAVLRSLAHQADIEPACVEVILCYVPGIDAVDDLIDSVGAAYPDLNVIRMPFSSRQEHAKGFMINDAGKIARGEWVVLLDSDTLVPPDFFSRLDRLPKKAEFVAPDGRKLLPPEVTAQVLLGEVRPWDSWQELMDGPGEYRRREAKGVPVGFCQIFRAQWLREIPYAEYEHFEWADMAFGKALIARVGKAQRLDGAPVLHLDHGSSQWFGTPKQF